MKRILCGIAAVAMLATGCSKDDSPAPANDEKVFTEMGALLNSTSRTTLDGLNVVWSENDAVSVWSDRDTSPVTFHIASGVGTSTASFRIPDGLSGITGTKFYSVYPANADGKISLPTSQRYTADANFASNLNPMAAVGADLMDMKFQNLCGILVVELMADQENTMLNKIVLTSTGAQTLAGTGSINFSAATPTIDWESTIEELTLACGVPLSTTVSKQFYFVVPAGTYANLRISVYTSDSFEVSLEKTRLVSLTVKPGYITKVGANFLISSKSYAVGDLYDAGGKKGVVFETFDNGRSGKILALNDCGAEATYMWGPSVVKNVVGVTNRDDGSANMTKVIAAGISNYPAFKACNDLGADWYLPASNEMFVIYDQWGALDDTFSSTSGASVMGGQRYWCSDVMGPGKIIYYMDIHESYDDKLTTKESPANQTASNVRAVATF